MNNAIKTIVVAFVICVFCSILVSVTAVNLRPIQNKNVELDMKKNILQAAKLYEEGSDIEELFKKVETLVIDFESGLPTDAIEASSYDMVGALKKTDLSIDIPADKDIGGLGKRPKYAKVYLVRDSEGKVNNVILPFWGKGLWSTMYGFLALESDANTIAGFSYYSQGETPGLGGEVDNPNWKAQWVGKKIYNEEGIASFQVSKTPSAEYGVDALSGATITGDGVQNSTNYWASNHAYGKFLDEVRQGNI